MGVRATRLNQCAQSKLAFYCLVMCACNPSTDQPKPLLATACLALHVRRTLVASIRAFLKGNFEQNPCLECVQACADVPIFVA